MKQLFLAIILSLSYANVPAEMYKWVDEEGNVQYTQTPPPSSAPATTVTPSPTNSISGGDKEESSTTTSGKEAPAEKSNGNPQTVKSCEDISKHLQTLTSSQKLMVPDKEETDKFVALPEETRQQQIATAKAHLQANCKDVKVTEERSTEPANQDATSKENTKTNPCEQARKDLTVAESTSDLLVQDKAKPNKFVPLSKEMREQKITQMKANVERFCKK
jgi:hypothetical protein